jgi:hypothetical protein
LLTVKDGVLDRHWESADRKTKTAQTVIPRGKVKEGLVEMHERPSGGTPWSEKDTRKIQTAKLLAALEGHR